jgi:1,4-dihydroxy-6-naphthoate synthase
VKLTLGFSPCPNDTFIFDALVNNKIDTHDLKFDYVLEDVQTLNTWAIQEKLDVTKISYGVLPLILHSYMVLNSGSALGKGVGPLLISKQKFDNEKSTIENSTIAIPGENTTAHMLFSLAFPNAKNKKFLIFNEIEDAVLSGQVDAGVIIHENRFTYEQKGLKKLMDLGEYWEQKMNVPIPLGGIVARRSLDKDTQTKVDEFINQSVKYAFSQYPHLTNFIKNNAQEMSEEVMRKHIDLYVNDFTISLQAEGKEAIVQLLKTVNSNYQHDVFVI